MYIQSDMSWMRIGNFFLVANLELQHPINSSGNLCVNLDVYLSSLPKLRYLLLEED